MQRYVMRRLLASAATVVVVVLMVFVLSRATGDPTYMILGDDATSEDIVALRQRLGLDKPLIAQLGIWVWNVLHGNAGDSLKFNEPVVKLYLSALPNTMKLAGVAILGALLVAIPLGVIAAVKRASIIDRAAASVAVLGMAAPSFWIGIVLIYLFSVQLGWLPTSRMGGPDHYVLPAIAMGASMMAGVMRLVRSSMLEVLDSEFVKLARIKGLTEARVYWRHSLRNALIPVLTLTGVLMGYLVAGAIVVETVFAWPGVGRLTYSAVWFRDYELLQFAVTIKVVFVVMINLVVDVLYAFVDPRIRYA
mgnify:CR=1 FL=1